MLIGASFSEDSMEWHVADSLRHLGCELDPFDTRRTINSLPPPLNQVFHKATTMLWREPERLFEHRLLRRVTEFAPDLVLVILGNQLSPKTVAQLRTRTKSPIVCWCQDQMTTLGRQFLLGSGYDAVFVKDRYLQDLFSRMIRSTSFHYLPEACNPRVHKPAELSAQDREALGCDVMIAGTLYYYRQEILRQLVEFDLKIWGSVPDWLSLKVAGHHLGRPIFTAEKARAVAAARISLNTLHFAEVNGLNCRAFELAGCGAFQLITSVPALAEHFVPEVEVATFSNIDELIDRIRYYLANPGVAQGIATRGQLRAHRDHTYERRLLEIFRVSLGTTYTAGPRPV
jgi:spore maturation protein CgeB